MADSFFGFDTSVSNLNDDEPGGEPSEDEYDALNDETFGHEADEYDWESQHEHLASQLESNRPRNKRGAFDIANSQLELSLSQLVLDETDAPAPRSFGSSVWRHDPPPPAPHGLTSTTGLKNVCTVEELERQLRQNQPPPVPGQNFFQPRYPPVILQRPPGLQAPVPLPFAPNQPINHINQSLNKIIGQNQMQQPHINQFMGNQYQGNHMGFNNHHQNINQMPPMNQLGQNVGQINQNVNPMGNMNQNVNPMGNMNHMGQNMGQMIPNGNPMGQYNQFPHVGNRMMAPPPGMNVPRQNLNQNMGQFNPNFRGPMPKPEQPLAQQGNMQHNMQQNMMMNQQMLQQQMKPQIAPNMKNNQSPLMNQINQSPQAKSTPNRKSPPMANQKVQKTRIYNNSQTKTMTSQNLVQLIQNTHPMLQYNNSYHNVNHHPMLNRNVFPNNFNQFTQQMNGSFSDNRISMNGDDSSAGSDVDEYAGLMSQREKQWLINIQMLQLNTGTPYIHDFYYTVFLERQANKEKEGIKEAHKANQQNHPFYSGGNKPENHQRERHNSVRHNSTSEEGATPRTYVPLQFENSLGKLQCGSVTAPRKIIDLEVVASEQQQAARASRASSVASIVNPNEAPRELKRTKQLLLDIEALYLVLLRLEELNDPLAISNALILKEREKKQQEEAAREAEEQEEDTNVFLRNIESVQRRRQDSPKTETQDKRQVVNLSMNQKPAPAKNLLDEDKDELVNKMFAGLLHGDRLQQMLAVRKGRTLLCRFLARCGGAHSRLRAVWSRVLRALPNAARRDDGGLAAMSPHYRKYIQNTSGWSSVLESCGILTETLDPARTPYVLTTSLTLSCVCALIESAAPLIATPEATANERQWYRFLKTLAKSLQNSPLNVAPPTKPLSETKLRYHLRQLESRTTIEILQRGKTAEFADLTKSDISMLLIKHLC